MYARIGLVLALAALSLAGCAGQQFEADVTRFHEMPAEALADKTITIEPARPELREGDFGRYARIVGEELAAAGFRPAGDAAADIVAQLNYLITPIAVEKSDRESRIGIGGGRFGGNVGVGRGTSIPVGQNDPESTYSRRLSLRLVDSTTETTVWEGRAVSIGRVSDLDFVLPFLARALLEDFPGASGQTVTVEIPVDDTGRPAPVEDKTKDGNAPENDEPDG